MARGPSVLLLDDGELDDIQEMLDALGAAYARVRGSAIVKGTPPPQQLLVSTPRRISSVAELEPSADGETPIKIVVVNEDSNALRAQLRRFGFDYLVRRPVHPEALRLLLMRAMYQGDERRREPRVAVGLEVSFRTGLLSRRALLADLSIRGCRLLSRQSIEEGRRIRVSIPEALETGTPISVTGRVLRVDRRKEGGGDMPYSAAVLFDAPSADAHEAIELLIEDLARGPATLRRGVTPTPDVDPQPQPFDSPHAGPADRRSDEASRAESAAPAIEKPSRATSQDAGAADPPRAATGQRLPGAIEVDVRLEPGAEEESSARDAAARGCSAGDEDAAPPEPAAGRAATRAGDRRAKRRAAYWNTVPAFGKRALRVLVGRDLSMGGMRIEPLPGLEIGDRLHLAIYGEAGESPFLVWSTVERDDGEGGMALRFDPLPAETGARLERLVGALPSVESLHDSETDAMGTVMSEILTG